MSIIQRMHFDPMNHYINDGYDLEDIKAACGILPIWANRCHSIGETMSKTMELMYPFFFQWYIKESDEWSIDSNGVFKYDGDPDLQPFCTMESDDEFVYIYPSAIVGVVNKKTNEQKYSRFD